MVDSSGNTWSTARERERERERREEKGERGEREREGGERERERGERDDTHCMNRYVLLFALSYTFTKRFLQFQLLLCIPLTPGVAREGGRGGGRDGGREERRMVEGREVYPWLH